MLDSDTTTAAGQPPAFLRLEIRMVVLSKSVRRMVIPLSDFTITLDVTIALSSPCARIVDVPRRGGSRSTTASKIRQARP